jgi:formylglycine-generating enzyme required for sulfatase activity
MVRVATGAGTDYCIDSTEVTRAEYAAFLPEASLSAQSVRPPTNCKNSNTSFIPTAHWPPGTTGDLPVDGVDWCDAESFCAWAGRRLCRGLGNADLWHQDGDFTDSTKSEWASACTALGTRSYPYGKEPHAGACADNSSGESDERSTVGPTACVGGVAGVRDMVGNVYEWLDACSFSWGVDHCALLGSAVKDPHLSATAVAQCSDANTVPYYQNFAGVGIRCCADVLR